MPPLPPLALTMGDPAGIGPEIALAAWQQRGERQLPVFAVYGDPAVFSARAALLGWPVCVKAIDSPGDAADIFARALPVVPVMPCIDVIAGRPDARNGSATIAAIDDAVRAVQWGSAAGLVTCPIAKSILYEAGFKHPGHTEYLAFLAEQAADNGMAIMPIMMLASDTLRVVPTTIHIPLADVPKALTAELLRQTIKITLDALRMDFGIEFPRVAVAGLNPHAGENGTIGREDADLIAPVIAALCASGHAVTGPHSADTLFHAAARRNYDAVVAMYHDQALIPIKTLAFDCGVNVTLGLPFVRTSPDHGTAFDIAGTGSASPESLIQALLLAKAITIARANTVA